MHSLFVNGMGIGVAKYLRLRKLTLASYLLRYTRCSIADIAYQFDFGTHQSFTRCFKKHFHQTPCDYRHSQCWDMSLVYPSALIPSHHIPCERVFLDDFMLIGNTGNINMTLGGNDFNTGNTNNDFISHYIKHINKVKCTKDFFVSGIISPDRRKYNQSTLALTMGRKHSNGHLLIEGGYYAKFTFSDFLDKSFNICLWADTKAAYEFKLIVENRATLTRYSAIDAKGRYQVEHFLPLITPKKLFY